MRKPAVFLHVALLFAAAGLACASVRGGYTGPPLPGRYRTIGRYQPTVDGRPEVLVVFSFESKPCYQFMQAFSALERRYAERVRFRGVPIFWGDQAPFATKLYLIAEKVGRQERIREVLFAARHEQGVDLADAEAVARLADQEGLGDLYAALVFSDEINARVDEAQALVRQYGLAVTPSAVVNRALLVTPEIAGGTVEQMTDSLSAMLRGLVGW